MAGIREKLDAVRVENPDLEIEGEPRIRRVLLPVANRPEVEGLGRPGPDGGVRLGEGEDAIEIRFAATYREALEAVFGPERLRALARRARIRRLLPAGLAALTLALAALLVLFLGGRGRSGSLAMAEIERLGDAELEGLQEPRFEVRARSAEGEILWRRVEPGRPTSGIEVLPGREGEPCAAYGVQRPNRTGEVVVLDASGQELFRRTFRPPGEPDPLGHEDDLFTMVDARVVDFDGDGRREVLAVFNHTHHGPNRTFVYDAEGRVVGRYVHHGHLYLLAVADVDGDGVRDILLRGFDNHRAEHGLNRGAVVALRCDARQRQPGLDAPEGYGDPLDYFLFAPMPPEIFRSVYDKEQPPSFGIAKQEVLVGEDGVLGWIRVALVDDRRFRFRGAVPLPEPFMADNHTPWIENHPEEFRRIMVFQRWEPGTRAMVPIELIGEDGRPVWERR